MREGNKLTALGIARLKTPGRYSDGHGLYLQVSETGTKSWLFRYKKRDERGRDNSHWMGLGPLYTYSLQEARERARWARQLIGSQRDPLAEKRAAEAALTVSQLRALTFKQAALDFLATDRVEQFKNAKHRQQWRSTLGLAFPVIGELPLQSIDSAMVLQALLPVWKKTPETGGRLRGRIEQSSHGRRLTSFLMARTRQLETCYGTHCRQGQSQSITRHIHSNSFQPSWQRCVTKTSCQPGRLSLPS